MRLKLPGKKNHKAQFLSNPMSKVKIKKKLIFKKHPKQKIIMINFNIKIKIKIDKTPLILVRLEQILRKKKKKKEKGEENISLKPHHCSSTDTHATSLESSLRATSNTTKK
jgi:hypothetical protein